LPSESCEWTPPTSLLPTAEMPRRTAASTERVAASAAGCSPLAVRFLPDSRPSAARRSRPNAPAAMRPPWFPVYFVNLSSNLALNAVRAAGTEGPSGYADTAGLPLPLPRQGPLRASECRGKELRMLAAATLTRRPGGIGRTAAMVAISNVRPGADIRANCS
jgi:hypothetical protein